MKYLLVVIKALAESINDARMSVLSNVELIVRSLSIMTEVARDQL